MVDVESDLRSRQIAILGTRRRVACHQPVRQSPPQPVYGWEVFDCISDIESPRERSLRHYRDERRYRKACELPTDEQWSESTRTACTEVGHNAVCERTIGSRLPLGVLR